MNVVITTRVNMSVTKKCTNFGCERDFDSEDNFGDRDACVYHPGEPFFHDAYKGWTCCGQKSTDFTTFLNFKGCQKGKHSDVARAPKPKPEVKEEPEVVVAEQEAEAEDEWEDGEWLSLEMKEASNCGQKEAKKEVKRVCKKCGEKSEEKPCVYHVGQTIFHETLKYYTCCPQKKFTDFEDFQRFKGCQEDHVHHMHVLRDKPREDYFQTETQITLVLYGLKGARAAGSHVRINGQRVEAEFKDSEGETLFEGAWDLGGRVAKSGHVRIERQKAEIVLKKIRNCFWNKVFI